MSSIRILFEQIEPSAPPILSDCSLNSLTIRPEILSEQKSKIEYRDCEAGTDVEKIDKCCGPSTLKVNAATKYEFQKLNATQIHRAINDPKLSEFLLRVYPLLREELDDSNLFNKLK